VERTAKAFAQIGRPWELVYVDDGSTDDTAAMVAAIAEVEPRVRLVRQRRNLGLTEALNRGFREARGDVIVFLPADLESDPQVDIPLLLDKLDQGGVTASASPPGLPTSSAAPCSGWTCTT
jgi:glycosyltransferase involved in cell wall biosynthesis